MFMQFWETELVMSLNGKTLCTVPVAMQCRIQDSLSRFILCLNPLSNLLNVTQVGNHLKDHRKLINHFLYDDDAKCLHQTKPSSTIRQLEDTEKYKYLVFDQYLPKNTNEIRKETEEKLMKRVNKILSTEKNERHDQTSLYLTF